MLRIVKNESDSKFPYQTWFSYPEPMDGTARHLLDGELKRVFREAGLTRYKFLSDTYGVTAAFGSARAQKSFYKTFGRVISQYSVDTIFTGENNKISIRKILSNAPA